MSDVIEKEVVDNYLEHELHVSVPDEDCSSCWSELLKHQCKVGVTGSCPTCEKFANKLTEDNKN